MAEGGSDPIDDLPEHSPTVSTGFYIPSSSGIKDTAGESLIYNEKVSAPVSSGSATQHQGMLPSFTFSGLPDFESTEICQPSSFRNRAHSAPSVLYHQVAMQLRSISDDYNKEYSSRRQDLPQLDANTSRRLSLPVDMAHQSDSSVLHRARRQRQRNTDSISEENSQDCVDVLPLS